MEAVTAVIEVSGQLVAEEGADGRHDAGGE